MTKFFKAAGVSALPLLTVVLFVPLLIYSGNAGEFTASYAELLLVFVPYAGVLCCVFGLAGLLMSESVLVKVVAVMSSLAILVWLQGNILVWDYGPLDGRSINWFLGISRGLLDTAIWVALLGFAIIASARASRILVQAAIAAMLIQVAAAATILASGDETDLLRSDVAENARAKHEVTQFSASRNVLHIVMDGFQTDIFKALVEEPANGTYKDSLAGFTLFENNVGPYPYTQMTVPALLTGKLYRNEVPAEEFIDAVLGGRTILDSAADAGFEIDIAAPVALKNTYARNTHTNAYGISSSDHISSEQLVRSEATRLIDLSLFRVVPHFAKALVYREDLWLFQAGAHARSFQHIQYFSDLAFVRELTEQLTVDREAPVYKMMHFMLSHRPTVGNEKCEYDGRRRTNRENVTNQARCGLDAVIGLLAKLQETGIYDDSLIVLMADHGAWVPVEGLVDDDGRAALDAGGVAMATPLLAIKPPGASGPFVVSVAPAATRDVPATIAALLKIDEDFGGESVFGLDPTAARDRRHFSYSYGDNKQQPGYLMKMQEFVTDGSPFDLSSWRRGQSYEPKGRIGTDESSD